MSAAVVDVLTLGQKELIRGRFLRQRDADGEPWYCVDCLADLPADYFAHWNHRCVIAPAAAVEHKTRTFAPGGETGHFDKRGRPMHSRAAASICSCGWTRWHDNRVLARSAARQHRDESAATAAGETETP